MTSTTTPDTSAPSATAPATVGELLHVNPHELEIGDNVRTEASIGRDFLASVSTHGVLQPITAIRRSDGAIVVRDGQRRTLAAREAGLAAVMVVVTPDTSSDDQARDIARIEHQFVANEDRADLTSSQRLGAVEQILNLGVSPTKTAKRLNLSREEVDAAAITVKSTRARNDVENGELTLEHAAILAEFEDDERAYDQLYRITRYNNHGQLQHTAQQMRDRRAADARRAEAGKDYAAAGFTVLVERPVQLRQAGLQRLEWMTRENGDRADTSDITDPTAWSVYLDEAAQYVDTTTGEVVDEDTVDWDTQDDPDLEPSAGLRHAKNLEARLVFEPAFFCHNTDSLVGLAWRDWNGYGNGGNVPQTEEDAERKRAEDTATRRRTILNNKAARSAQQVRADWLRILLARKTPPKAAAAWVATCLAGDPTVVGEYQARDTAAELLGLSADKLTSGDAVDNATEGRAQVLTLAVVIGGYEARTRKFGWRATSYARIDQYLQFLADLGYPLAPIEEVMVGTRAADTVTLPD